jgi:hypothetical protein
LKDPSEAESFLKLLAPFTEKPMEILDETAEEQKGTVPVGVGGAKGK